MKELSRWYDFDYTFADRTLTSTVFMGSVPRYGDFREVLRILEMSGGIKFRQRGRKITVEKK
jgi:transmembrane sensor